MAIVIQNIGGDMNGDCRYQIRINREVIAEFTHDRRRGLSECLRLASEAVEGHEVRRFLKLIEMMK